jgi:hypothetical protein
MTRLLFLTAFLLGAAAIIWMGLDFAGSNLLAFAVTGVIGGVYLLGIVELLQFRRATKTLTGALGVIPAKTEDARQWLDRWLGSLDPSLQNAVRLRIEGERVGLPAPVFTPYLVGLLVMLGLLGTFVGMVDTLSGAVLALEGSTELEAIRSGLAAPIKGLGVAFGTSVAGVAASAMLGLISTLARRERMLATRQLDSKVVTVFREFSLAHNRQQAFDALQSQAAVLPAVADKLQSVAAQLESMGNRLGEQLLANQNQFHETVGTQYTALADSVDQSLRESLAASGRSAGESIKPVIAQVMADIHGSALETQQRLAANAQDQLQAFGQQFDAANTAMLESFDRASSTWVEQSLTLQSTIQTSMTDSARQLAENSQTTSSRMLAQISDLLESTERLLEARAITETALLDNQGKQIEQITATLTSGLGTIREQESQSQLAARDRLAELESTVTKHLTLLGKGLEEPLTRLIETASETPKAAADVIAQLHTEIGNNMERDNQLLLERQRVMEELTAVAGSLERSTTAQQEAVESLVSAAASRLQDVSTGFGEHVVAEASNISSASTHLAGSAAELASLGEAFGHAVQLFNNSNETMIEHLDRVGESMEKSSARSDEQMAYYVAQAREIIDQSMLSQREIVEDLRGLGSKEELLEAEVG